MRLSQGCRRIRMPEPWADCRFKGARREDREPDGWPPVRNRMADTGVERARAVASDAGQAPPPPFASRSYATSWLHGGAASGCLFGNKCFGAAFSIRGRFERRRLVTRRPVASGVPGYATIRWHMHWRPIRYAPLDGTAVLARCADPPQGYHLVYYVDGAWMDVHGGYILTEKETGLPTHYKLLSPGPTNICGDLWGFVSAHPSCIVLLLAAAALSMALGAALENRFDLLPG